MTTTLFTWAQVAPLFTHVGLAAAGAAAVAIPIAIHLLSRLRRRPQSWGAMRFVMEAFRRHQHRLRLEQWLLLALRCLIVLLLGLALAGPMVGGYAQQLGIDGPGRLVCLVIDDTLSSQVADGGGAARFEQLRSIALKTLDQLQPQDRVILWTSAKPARALIRSGSLEHAAARQALEQMQPRFSSGDLQQVLAELDQDIAALPAAIEDIDVLLLSDFSQGSFDLTRVSEQDFTALRRRARVLALRPSAAVENVQIAALSPRRHLVLADGRSSVALPLTLELRRFVDQTSQQLVHLQIAVHRSLDQPPLATTHRNVRWLPGQGQTQVAFEIPVELHKLGLANNVGSEAGSGQHVIVTARFDDDALPADNQRWATFEVRRRLMVGLIDHDARSVSEPGASLEPRQWLRLALAPSDISSSIELQEILPTSVDQAQTAALDAAMVLRPDLVNDIGWAALAQLAQRGGVVWIFVPTQGAASLWTGALRDRLDLPWQLGLEPVAAPAPAPDAANPQEPASVGAWPLALDQSAPEALNLLSSDWNALLSPIRVSQRLDVQNVADSNHVWLSTADGGPLLVASPLGDGYVLLLTAAIDPAWTNLPTKPLLVPLLHESLRSLLGESGQARRLSQLVAGDRPQLQVGWGHSQRLVGPGGELANLQRVGESLTTSSPIEQPGVYVAAPEPATPLAVNVDATAGDTRAIDAAMLSDYLGRKFNWSWLNPDDPLARAQAPPQRASLGWPLLWAVLVLVLIETWLARYFSHTQSPAVPIWKRVYSLMRESGS